MVSSNNFAFLVVAKNTENAVEGNGISNLRRPEPSAILNAK